MESLGMETNVGRTPSTDIRIVAVPEQAVSLATSRERRGFRIL